MANPKKQVFFGTFVSSKSPKELNYRHDTLVCVDGEGKIVKVDNEGCDRDQLGQRLHELLGWKLSEVDVHIAKSGEFFFPGFVGEYSYRAFYKAYTNKSRFPCSCISVPKRGHIWKDNASGLVRKVHVSPRVQSQGLEQGASSIWLMCATNIISRNNNGGLLCDN
jgi:hypothetical protein